MTEVVCCISSVVGTLLAAFVAYGKFAKTTITQEDFKDFKRYLNDKFDRLYETTEAQQLQLNKLSERVAILEYIEGGKHED